MKTLVKAVAGSHLFGLNTPQSDKDYKGVYMPDKKDIILGQIKRSVHDHTNPTNERNTSEDIDVEFYSLDKFFRMLQEGQTVALELLFTPEEFIIEKDPIWDEIVAMRDQLLHKKVTAFIGYAKSQAAKYGIRGSRMGDLGKAITMLDFHAGFRSELRPTLGHIWTALEKFVETHEYSSIMDLSANKNMNNKIIPHWEIVGRKFDKSVRIEYVIGVLQKILDGYGDRSKQAKENKGIDWKAISHALRVCHQGQELLNTGKITLPISLVEGSFIKGVKRGEFDFTKVVQPFLEDEMSKLEKAKEQSELPEKLDEKFVDNLIYKYYYNEIVAQD